MILHLTPKFGFSEGFSFNMDFLFDPASHVHGLRLWHMQLSLEYELLGDHDGRGQPLEIQAARPPAKTDVHERCWGADSSVLGLARSTWGADLFWVYKKRPPRNTPRGGSWLLPVVFMHLDCPEATRSVQDELEISSRGSQRGSNRPHLRFLKFLWILKPLSVSANFLAKPTKTKKHEPIHSLALEILGSSRHF